MPNLQIDSNDASYQIKAYQPGSFLVNEQTLAQSIIISPQKLIENWAPQQFDQLTLADLSDLMALKPAILLIGTGSTQHFLPMDWYGALINLGIGVEVMNTHAACRTYNALSAEGRDVVAALMIR